MISPLAVWWRAVSVIDPRIEYDSFVGLSVAPVELAVCAPNCQCRLCWGLKRASMAGLARCGFQAVSLKPPGAQPAAVSRRVLATVGRGTPVVCIGGARAELIMGSVDARHSVRVQRWVCDAWEERSESVSAVISSDIYAIRRSRDPRGFSSQRNLRSLLAWLAASLRPPSRGGCAVGGPRQIHAEGLAAYDIWAANAKVEDTDSGASRAGIWHDIKRSGAIHLESLAGSRRTRFANRLRQAATQCDGEAALCWSGATAATPAVVENGAQMAMEAAYLIGEAALPVAGLPSSTVTALLGHTDEPLHGVALNELLYLARAGTRPLRELAAKRLADAEGLAATSTLIELLYDEDGRVASTALWSLVRNQTPRLSGALIGAARNGVRFRSGLDYSFSLRLLLESALLKTHAADRMEDLRTSLRTDDPENPLVGDIDVALRAAGYEQPEPKSRDSGE
jgi:hypothetical protein